MEETGESVASPGLLKLVLSVYRRKRFISPTENISSFLSPLNFIRVNCCSWIFCAAGEIITVLTSGEEFAESSLVLWRCRSRNPSALLILLYPKTRSVQNSVGTVVLFK